MAACDEVHHFGSIQREIEFHHFLVELLRLGGGDADRVDAVRHQDAVHHVPRRALVAVEKELLQRSEQEERCGLLERFASPEHGHPFLEHPVQFRGTRLGRQGEVAAKGLLYNDSNNLNLGRRLVSREQMRTLELD